MEERYTDKIELQLFAEPPADPPTPPAEPPANPPSPQSPPIQEGTMIPKYRFDEINTRCQAAEAKIAELQKIAGEVKQKDDRIAALEKELNDTKTAHELEKTNAKRTSAIEAAIKDKVVDIEVVQKLLDTDKITFNDKGEVVGLEEQLQTLQTSKPYLWKPAKQIIKPSDKGKVPQEKTYAQQLAEKKKAQLGVTAKQSTYFK